MPAGKVEKSGSVAWCTPPEVRDFCWEVYGGPPQLDPASNPGSIMGAQENWYFPERDGLDDPWGTRPATDQVGKTVWLNEPFGTTWRRRSDGLVFSPKELEKFYNLKGKALYEKATAEGFKRSVIGDWTKLALRNRGDLLSTTLCILPAAPETSHWHRDIWSMANRILWPKGRISYLDGATGKPLGAPQFPSAIVLWTPYHQFIERFDRYGGRLGEVTRSGLL